MAGLISLWNISGIGCYVVTMLLVEVVVIALVWLCL